MSDRRKRQEKMSGEGRRVTKDRVTTTEKKVALIELEHVLYPNVGLDNNLISSQTCHVYSGHTIKQTPHYRHNLFRSPPNHGQMLKEKPVNIRKPLWRRPFYFDHILCGTMPTEIHQ